MSLKVRKSTVGKHRPPGLDAYKILHTKAPSKQQRMAQLAHQLRNGASLWLGSGACAALRVARC